MSGGRMPEFGLSFDPRALTDLLQAPSDVRDVTLSYLQEIVTAQRFGRHLTGDLEGYRKIPLSQRQWRIIYGLRPAPAMSEHRKEIHVVAVRPRDDVYDVVGRRLGMNRRPLPARAHAARARPPQLAARQPRPPVPLPSAMPSHRLTGGAPSRRGP